MTTIPNQLNITINNSVPGYQKIEYKPSMTIPDISKDDKTIRFNPMIKLNKNIVDKVPENLRKKQFFNKGLFDSLLNYNNGVKANSLLQATRNGYVNNNINVTLNAIFPENSILYIDKKPYVIADVQWTSGDWRIYPKKNSLEIDSSNNSKVFNPKQIQTGVKDENIIGKNQIEQLPAALVYGENYTGPKDETKSTSPEATSPSPSTDVKVLSSPESTPESTPEAIPVAIPVATQVATPSTAPTTTLATTQIATPATAPVATPATTPATTQVATPLATPVATNNIIQNPNTSPSTEKYPSVVQPTTQLKMSSSTQPLREFLKEANFYNLIGTIYNASTSIIKKIINKSLNEPNNYVGGSLEECCGIILSGLAGLCSKPCTKETLLKKTNLDTKVDAVLDKKLYDESVNEIKIIENSGKGNCFFIAVADGLNFHNYLNQDDRIISGRYGTGVNIYTQLYLRTLVSDYIQNWSGLDNYLTIVAPVIAQDLNDLFVKQINGIKKAKIDSGDSDDITSENYISIANSIFNSNDNFLVKDVETVPFNIDEYNTPFKVLKQGQINQYILNSNFWANEIVIYALCSKLNLNIIPIENLETPSGKTILRIPFANFSKEFDNWNKYLFLYYHQNHFELMTFNNNYNVERVNSLEPSINKKFVKKMKIIFNRNNEISELLPIYILLIVFGSYYSTIIDKTSKNNFTFKPEFMLSIETVINNVLYNSKFYSTNFYPNFKIYFPDSNIKKPNISLLDNANNNETNNETNNNLNKNISLDDEPIADTTYSKSVITPFEIGDPYKGGENSVPSKNESQLSYNITIDMELRPGTSLTPEELKNAKCYRKMNSIKKSWSELTGKPYTIKPIYTDTKTASQNNTQNNTQKNIPYSKGGKHNTTIKNRKL